jgi:glycerol kinase
MVSGAVPEAGSAYASLKRAIKGSVEEYIASAAADDPRMAAFDSAAQQFRRVFEALSRSVGAPEAVIGCGEALLKSPSLSQAIADALGASLTLSTQPEVAGRGAALWALDQIGAIEDLRALAASIGTVFEVSAARIEAENTAG